MRRYRYSWFAFLLGLPIAVYCCYALVAGESMQNELIVVSAAQSKDAPLSKADGLGSAAGIRARDEIRNPIEPEVEVGGEEDVQQVPTVRLSATEKARILEFQHAARAGALRGLLRLGGQVPSLESMRRSVLQRRAVALNDIVIERIKKGQYSLSTLQPGPRSDDEVIRTVAGWTTIRGVRYGVVVEVVLADQPYFTQTLKESNDIESQQRAAYMSSFNRMPMPRRKAMISNSVKLLKQIKKLRGHGKEDELKRRELKMKLEVSLAFQWDTTNWVIY